MRSAFGALLGRAHRISGYSDNPAIAAHSAFASDSRDREN